MEISKFTWKKINNDGDLWSLRGLGIDPEKEVAGEDCNIYEFGIAIRFFNGYVGVLTRYGVLYIDDIGSTEYEMAIIVPKLIKLCKSNNSSGSDSIVFEGNTIVSSCKRITCYESMQATKQILPKHKIDTLWKLGREASRIYRACRALGSTPIPYCLSKDTWYATTGTIAVSYAYSLPEGFVTAVDTLQEHVHTFNIADGVSSISYEDVAEQEDAAHKYYIQLPYDIPFSEFNSNVMIGAYINDITKNVVIRLMCATTTYDIMTNRVVPCIWKLFKHEYNADAVRFKLHATTRMRFFNSLAKDIQVIKIKASNISEAKKNLRAYIEHYRYVCVGIDKDRVYYDIKYDGIRKYSCLKNQCCKIKSLLRFDLEPDILLKLLRCNVDKVYYYMDAYNTEEMAYVGYITDNGDHHMVACCYDVFEYI